MQRLVMTVRPASAAAAVCVVAVRALLEPQDLRADGDGVPRHRRRLLRRAEHVHDIDGHVNLAQ